MDLVQGLGETAQNPSHPDFPLHALSTTLAQRTRKSGATRTQGCGCESGQIRLLGWASFARRTSAVVPKQKISTLALLAYSSSVS
jgi:hypothetical protein